MLNVIAFGPNFFQSIRHLDTEGHRSIIRDLQNPKLAYTIHSTEKRYETFDDVMNDLLGITAYDDLLEPDVKDFSHQSIRLWKSFFKHIYSSSSNPSRLVLKDYNDFLAYNFSHSKQIWIHPDDALEFNINPDLYAQLSFPSGRSSDEFYNMIVQQSRFSESFSDYPSNEKLLEKVDVELLHLPSQFYRTIVLFDKYLSHAFFKYESNEGKKDQDLEGFTRFLKHLQYRPNHRISTIVLIGQYPYKNRRLERRNNVEEALKRVREKTKGLDYLRDLQIEVVFVCPWDFPDVYHDRYCAWSALHTSHENNFYFMSFLEDCLGNDNVLDCEITHFWLTGGRGFQVYEQIASSRSFWHVTYNFQDDIKEMEKDVFYRFSCWPYDHDTNKRREWSSIQGHSKAHGFSPTYAKILG